MRTLTALALVVAALPTLAYPADHSVDSRIDAVTVYLGTARVIRRATVELPAGDARLFFTNLSPQLLDESLRARGAGTAKAKIFGLDVEPMAHVETPHPDLKAAEERVRRLEEQDRIFEDSIRAINQRREFVDSLKQTSVRPDPKAALAIDSKEWGSLVEVVGKQYELIAGELRKAELGRKELAKRGSRRAG
jgi:hypothetical protein